MLGAAAGGGLETLSQGGSGTREDPEDWRSAVRVGTEKDAEWWDKHFQVPTLPFVKEGVCTLWSGVLAGC